MGLTVNGMSDVMPQSDSSSNKNVSTDDTDKTIKQPTFQVLHTLTCLYWNVTTT